MVVGTPKGPYCPPGGFRIDPWLPVARAVVRQAHADHLRAGGKSYRVAEPGGEIARLRTHEGTTLESLPDGLMHGFSDSLIRYLREPDMDAGTLSTQYGAEH